MSIGPRMLLQVKQALAVNGGATESIFPQVEAWLFDGDDHMRALEFIASQKAMERYRSIIDFLFCELVPRYKKDCFKFYLGKGKQLKDTISVRELTYYNNVLLVALEIAFSLFTEQRKLKWAQYRSIVWETISAA